MGVKAVLRIAYRNQNFFVNFLIKVKDPKRKNLNYGDLSLVINVSHCQGEPFEVPHKSL